MLSSSEKRLCAAMVRRAGFSVDDQSIHVAIADIESGRPTTSEWGEYLTNLVERLTVAK